MIPIFSVVGSSNSGKTTLIEKLIPEFRKRGYRVGTIKHASHGFDMDREGKDSWRHLQAGADTVMVSSPNQAALVTRNTSGKLADLVRYLKDDVDVIITEGCKKERMPKIEVFRQETGGTPVCLNDPTLIAIATDHPIPASVPVFGLDDVEGIVTLIETMEPHPLG